jgi:AraC-like DNA-binding protein
VPLAWFIGYGLPAGFTDLVLGGELVREPDAQARELDRLLHERWVSDHESREPDRVRSSMLEVEARIRRLAVSLGAPRRRRAGRAAAAGTAGQAAPVERIAEHLARHYREQLTVAEVAGASGLHPNYAMMLFKQSFGLSIWEYLTRLRLSHAQRLLVTTDEKVLEVALDAGFSSLSRFYDIFQSRVGCTPSAYRETHTKKA